MLSQPTQANGRWQYETGTAAIVPNATTGAPTIPTQRAWDEDGALIYQGACYVSTLEVVTKESSATLYVLLYDVVASLANAQQALAGNLGAARYTYGPIAPGGFVVRDWPEVHPGRGGPFYTGTPFDRGVLMLLSTTPTLFTLGVGSRAHVIARGTSADACP